jgi:glycosyltransferase involved in cell wall biosynthesis
VLRGATIICVGSIDWAFNWQPPQEVATAFAAAGNHVLFVENTGVRRPSLKDLGRLRARFRAWRAADHAIRVERKGLDILSPLLVPLPYSRIVGRVNRHLLLRTIRRWLRTNGGGPLIVITFLPTPLVHDLIDALDPALVVYYCIDRLPASSPGARKLVEPEHALLARADLTLTTSSSLRAMAEEHASRVEMIESGVRSAEFARARDASAAPEAFRGLRGPVIGFTGTLRDSLDFGLLCDAAALAPDLNFLFAGPVMADVTRFASYPNVRLIGQLPHAYVIEHVVHFDAGILPYVRNAFTAYIVPAKLKEYLAAGLPVVSTTLPEMVRFADEHPGTIALADDAAGFVAALRAAVASYSPEAAARRMAIARTFDWTEQMRKMSAFIEAALAAKRVS